MAIQKFRNPLIDDGMSSNFSSMLDRFFNDSLNSRNMMASFTPHVDTSESENGYEIEVSLPGLKKEDIIIDFQEGRLTISGERKLSEENKSKKYYLVESQYGAFTRSFCLPETINAEGIEAAFEDGILHITVPKDVRKTMRHQIQIKGAETKNTSSQNGKEIHKQEKEKVN